MRSVLINICICCVGAVLHRRVFYFVFREGAEFFETAEIDMQRRRVGVRFGYGKNVRPVGAELYSGVKEILKTSILVS